MIDPVSGGPHTAHTTNPVPFILVTDDGSRSMREDGSLRDISPTILGLLNIGQPKEMTGGDLRAPAMEKFLAPENLQRGSGGGIFLTPKT